MTPKITESTVEEAVLGWFDELGYAVLRGADIEPDKPGAERNEFTDPILPGRLRDALERLNPDVPTDAIDEAYRKITRPDSPSLVVNNRAFHRMLTDGLTVEFHNAEGRITGEPLKLIDFDDPDNNDWLAVNQFTVVEGQINRRPDVVIFINGLPLAMIELKNPADEKATIHTAFNQLQTYKAQIPAVVHVQRGSGGVGRAGGADRHADGGQGMVHAVAHRRRGNACAGDYAGA